MLENKKNLEKPEELQSFEAKKVTRRTKPNVEGINVPDLETGTFLSSENKNNPIIKVSRIISTSMAERASQKKRRTRGFLFTASILAAIIVFTFAAYKRYWTHASSSITSTTPTAISVAATPETQNINPDLLNNPSAVKTVTSASSSPFEVPTSTNITKLKIRTTPTGFLNVRAEPSPSSAKITQVKPGEIFTYSKVSNGWYYIALTNGQFGWVISDYVSLQ